MDVVSVSGENRTVGVQSTGLSGSGLEGLHSGSHLQAVRGLQGERLPPEGADRGAQAVYPEIPYKGHQSQSSKAHRKSGIQNPSRCLIFQML